jgi:hypothetical protein
MATLEEIIGQLDSLTAESLDDLARFVEYLRWRQSPGLLQPGGQPWSFDFVENFRQATVSADQDPAGMEVQIGEAACSGDWQMALWQHPPVLGSAIIEYQVPVPAGVRNLRMRFDTGIRDGSHLAEGNVVAFRIFVNGWKVWSDTQHAQRWKPREIVMPTLRGDVARIQFVTDGLGNHEWAWAVWAQPRLEGEIEGGPQSGPA